MDLPVLFSAAAQARTSLSMDAVHRPMAAAAAAGILAAAAAAITATVQAAAADRSIPVRISLESKMSPAEMGRCELN